MKILGFNEGVPNNYIGGLHLTNSECQLLEFNQITAGDPAVVKNLRGGLSIPAREQVRLTAVYTVNDGELGLSRKHSRVILGDMNAYLATHDGQEESGELVNMLAQTEYPTEFSSYFERNTPLGKELPRHRVVLGGVSRLLHTPVWYLRAVNVLG